jgi:hypothetical protein
MSITKVKKRMEFVARHSTQGNRVTIIVPKEHLDSVSKLRNPMHVIVEEII